MLGQPRITAYITLLVGGNETRPHCPERANQIQMVEEGSPHPNGLLGLYSDSPTLSVPKQLDPTHRLAGSPQINAPPWDLNWHAG